MTESTALISNPATEPKTAVTMTQLVKWKSKLQLLMADLISGNISLIEFGKPAEITSPGVADIFTRIRIRRKPDNSGFMVSEVHVFFGEKNRYTDTYSSGRPEEIEELVDNVMAEVEHWTQDRARIGKNYQADINAGLDFSGHAIDRVRPNDGI